MVSLLRFLTCGSVDDGKSTLIGRMLHDCGAVAKDKLEGLDDFSLLADGLEAERAQGITIDVAYLYFATEKRRFILADTPGHEQYTRNMATGASNADLALVLVDATRGILTQTRRHSRIARLLGIKSFVLAVNKMDLAGYDAARFAAVRDDYAAFAEAIGVESLTAIPVSALAGDNVTELSARTPWYAGPSLLAFLEQAEPAAAAPLPFRMPVQSVIRNGRRLYAGTIASGAVRPGDAIVVAPAGTAAEVARIVTMEGDLDQAGAGQAVAIALASEVDCSRGDMLAAAGAPPQVADQFEATIIWMADEPLLPGRQYLLKLGTQSVAATVHEPKYKLAIDTMEELAAKTLVLNEIGVANVWTARPIAFEPYEASRALGGFILIDRISGATLAAGLVHFALRRSENVHEQALAVTAERRAGLMRQAPRLLWFTGLSGAGKSTIANLVEAKLHARGRHTFLLDGDNVRLGLNKDLGFTAADRVENIRRAGEAAKLMIDAGLIVLTAFISPFRAERALARNLVGEGQFVELFIDTPLAEAERRDTKGLYRKARAGKLANFTGVDSPYEVPENPEIRIDTMAMDAEAAADLIVRYLEGE
ncbi:MAG: bifunctional enzyme CysN/CysC [Sphingomonadales bacterium]|jgi:bifunctional enzyme CysN/CysC|nr:bifunctional enzyme CysN/CysC [Sphingomonadales bacterium]